LAEGGLMVDGDWVESKDQDPNGTVRLVQLADIGNGVFLNRSSRFLTMAKAHELKCTFLQPGDVLIARMPDPLGRACVFPGLSQPAVTAVDVCIWRPGPNGPSPEWLTYFVNSPPVRAQLASLAGGTTRQRVSGGNLKKLELPTPPTSVQTRIVVRLEELLRHSKAARDELRRIPQLTDRYKRLVLAKALNGKMTAQWRSDNPGAQTVTNLLYRDPTRAHRTGGRNGSGSTGTEVFGYLPENWQWVPVEAVGEVILGRQRSPENHTGPNMRPYVRAANITWGGWELTDVKTMNFDDRDFAAFKLQVGDVLINEGSGSAKEVGKPAIWNDEIADCCFQNTLVAVRPRAATSDYLYFVLLNAAMSGAFVDETRGVNIHHIGRAGLAQFPIPLPPFEEQDEIVRLIRAAFGSIGRLLSETSRATALIDRLEDATLSKAFEGELAI
jgi:type I restriction enzyme S subunit